MRCLRSLMWAVPALLAGFGAAQAADASLTSDPFAGYELRVSGMGHALLPTSSRELGGYDLGANILVPIFSKDQKSEPNPWIPRAHLGSTLNLNGKTSFVYSGLTWTVPIQNTNYFTFDFGGALNNGKPEGAPDRAAMGCHVTFRESATLGHSISENVSIGIMIEHFSNAFICDKNDGITNIGLVFGYKF